MRQLFFKIALNSFSNIHHRCRLTWLPSTHSTSPMFSRWEDKSEQPTAYSVASCLDLRPQCPDGIEYPHVSPAIQKSKVFDSYKTVIGLLRLASRVIPAVSSSSRRTALVGFPPVSSVAILRANGLFLHRRRLLWLPRGRYLLMVLHDALQAVLTGSRLLLLRYRSRKASAGGYRRRF